MKLYSYRTHRLFKISKSTLTTLLSPQNVFIKNKPSIQLIQNLFQNNNQHNCSLTENIGIVQKFKTYALDYFDKQDIINQKGIVAKTVLINFYSHFGQMNKANNCFKSINNEQRDISIWNTMIDGYAKIGDICNVQMLFDEMNKLHITPNDETYKILINACNEPMVAVNLINNLSQNGMIYFAYKLLLEYEIFNDKSMDNIYKEIMWKTLVFGCRLNMSQNKDDDTMISASVLLSNIYGAGADYDKVNEIRAEMKRRGWKKKPGISEIDVYGTLHKFYAGWGYRRTKEYKVIDTKLEDYASKFEEYGFKRDYSAITRQLKDWETPDAVLNRHSEKLAVTWGMMNTEPDYLIVINKNLRICVDCHNFMKIVSKEENRKIICADNNRVHTFENGKCNCNDYW